MSGLSGDMQKLAAGGPSGGSGQALENACSNAGGDTIAAQHCNAHKLAVAAAVKDGAMAGLFTITGSIGAGACARQSDDEKADKAYLATTSPTKSAMEDYVTKDKTHGNAVDSINTEVGKTADFHTNSIVPNLDAFSKATDAASKPVGVIANMQPTVTATCIGEAAAFWAPVDASLTKLTGSFGAVQTATQTTQSTDKAVGGTLQTLQDNSKSTVTSSKAALSSTSQYSDNHSLTLKKESEAIQVTSPSIPAFATADASHEDEDASKASSARAHDELDGNVSSTKTFDGNTQTAMGNLKTSASKLSETSEGFKESANTALATYQQIQGPLASCAATESASTTSPKDCVNCQQAILDSGITVAISSLPGQAADLSGQAKTLATNSGELIKTHQGVLKAFENEATTNGEAKSSLTELAAADQKKSDAWDAAEKTRPPRETMRHVYNGAQIATYGADVAGTGAILAYTAALGVKVQTAQIMTQATSLAGGAAAKFLTKPDESVGQQPMINCPLTYIADFGQAAVRGLNLAVDIKMASSEESYYKQLASSSGMAVQANNTMGGGGSEGGGAATGGMLTPNEPKLLSGAGPDTKAAITPQGLAANMATGATLDTPPMETLQNNSGLTPESVASGLLDGQSPMQIASTGTAAQNAATAGLLTALDQNKDKFTELAKDTVGMAKPTEPQISFASSNPSRARASSSDSGFDMGSLLSALMPKAPEKTVVAVKAVKYRAPATDRLTADGLHPADRSLFEVVDARYADLNTRFLNGELQLSAPAAAQVFGAGAGNAASGVATGDAPSAPAPVSLPKNPYLRK